MVTMGSRQQTPSAVKLQFDQFELDSEAYELRRDGAVVALEPKMFDLLYYLAQRPGEVVTRDALLEAVWRGRLVSDTTIASCLKGVRKALGDSGKQQRFLQTVRGRGFRFVGNVQREGALPSATAESPPAEFSLLVLAYGSGAAAAFAASLENELSTLLMRVPLLKISAHGARYADKRPDLNELAENLGVRYLLQADVSEADADYAVALNLSDAVSGLRVWGERFTFPRSGDLAAAVSAIVIKTEPQLHQELLRAVRREHQEPSARERYLQATGVLAFKGWDRASFFEAVELLREACAEDPEFALAAAELAMVLGAGDRLGFLDDPASYHPEILAAAERALALDGNDSRVLGFAGCALADVGAEERAMPLLRRATEINPFNAQAWVALGTVYLLNQDIEHALKYLSRGIEISAVDSRLGMWRALHALALFGARDLDAANQQAELACQRDPNSYLPRVVIAAVRMALGAEDGARTAIAEARRLLPSLTYEQVAQMVGKKLAGALMST